MDYNELLEAFKEEVANATDIEECFLIVHEYHGLLLEMYAREAEQHVLDGEDDLPF